VSNHGERQRQRAKKSCADPDPGGKSHEIQPQIGIILLSNALRYTKTAGEVRVEISDSENSTQVAVENTGDEIDPNIIPRLFDRFYRADPSRSQPDAEGAGLGLAITRAIVQAHGGKIDVSSAQGRTRFTITFMKMKAA
jgi:two-component system heavy metal sensor histidine kinase CusS